jgi:hypothetical protein
MGLIVMCILTDLLRAGNYVGNDNHVVLLFFSSAFQFWIHSKVCESPPFVPALRQIYLVHTFSPYFPSIHSYIIFPSTLRSSALS